MPHEEFPGSTTATAIAELRALLPAVAALTRRQGEVLCWIVEGKGRAEIATILGISVRTVEEHEKPIFACLCVENAHSACACVHHAIEAGLRAELARARGRRARRPPRG